MLQAFMLNAGVMLDPFTSPAATKFDLQRHQIL